MVARNKMAIEKSYFSTYGWEISDAYYKIGEDFFQLDNNLYEADIFIYRNEQKRNDNENDYLRHNKMKFTIDRSSFDENKTELENFKTQGYEHLKTLTKSFVNDSIDV